MLSPEVLAELDSLLASARAKESQALDTLISKSLPHMRKYLRDPSHKPSPSLSEADEDVLKDAAARVALKFSSFEGTSAPEFLSWLKKIVVRRKIDSLRKQGRKKRRDDALSRTTTEEHATAPAAQTPASRTSERMDAIETWLTVLSALLELPTKQREAFWLCVICERDREEVATRLGGTRGSIAGDINRARSALADVLRSVQQAEQSVPPERPLVGGCFLCQWKDSVWPVGSTWGTCCPMETLRTSTVALMYGPTSRSPSVCFSIGTAPTRNLSLDSSTKRTGFGPAPVTM